MEDQSIRRLDWLKRTLNSIDHNKRHTTGTKQNPLTTSYTCYLENATLKFYTRLAIYMHYTYTYICIY